jgi:hypothetical protein
MPTTQKREERFVRLPPDLYALVDMAEHEDRSIASAIRTNRPRGSRTPQGGRGSTQQLQASRGCSCLMKETSGRRTC